MDETDASMDTSQGMANRKIIGRVGGGAPRSMCNRASMHITGVSANTASGLNLRPMFIAPSKNGKVNQDWINGNTALKGEAPVVTHGPKGTAPLAHGELEGLLFKSSFTVGLLNSEICFPFKGTYPLPYYAVSDTGSMKGAMMVSWLEECVVPFMPPGKTAVLVMDGFKGHLALPFLRRLKELNYKLVLRYPHSSHKTQV